MFESKTLFVVGAGASSEAGLPLAKKLKSDIAGRVDIRFNIAAPLEQQTGDPVITEAIRRHVRDSTGGRDINPYLHAGRHISRAMPQAISIDNFIDTHRKDEKIELCGKLAIVQAILHTERRSQLS